VRKQGQLRLSSTPDHLAKNNAYYLARSMYCGSVVRTTSVWVGAAARANCGNILDRATFGLNGQSRKMCAINK
jgi:hypothetical protein